MMWTDDPVADAAAYTEEQDAALSPLNSAAPTGSPQMILMGTPPTPSAAGNKGLVFTRAINNMRESPTDGDCIHIT